MTKDEILNMLRSASAPISGEEMSRALGVSRAAVWKAVDQLRQEGYAIEAATRRGYRLAALPDRLDAAVIAGDTGADVHVYEEVTSTNTVARQLAADGCPAGTCVLAERQTAGKGRRGRGFASEAGGLYFSIVLRPGLLPEQIMHLTAMTAVAIRRAILETTGLDVGIKWTNDLVYDRRKLCGILTELSIEAETRTVDYVVAGIGVNCNQTAFAPEIADVAASIRMETGKPVDRSLLANAMLRQMLALARELQSGRAAWLAEFAAHCITIGQPVQIIRGDTVREAFAEGIDGEAALLVRYPDGTREAVNSGEVSVRGLYGYVT